METITKGELAERGLRLLGINTRSSSATPEEIQDFLKFMEDWNAFTNAIGKRIGWVEESEPDPNTQSGIPNWAHTGVYSNVAVLHAEYFQKQPTDYLRRLARVGMQTITNETVELQEYQYSNRMPKGNGDPWRTYSNRYYQKSDDIITDADFLKDEGGGVISSGEVGE